MILPSLVSLLLTGIPLQAAPIRISFLADQSALQETVNLLIASGCHLDGVSGFKKVVDQFNSNPLKLDLARFPSAQNGYYSFASVSNLVAAMPETWCTIDHPYEINCFDTAILLTQEQLRASLQADEMTGPFLVEMMMGTNEVRSIAATPSDAFELVSPEWYRKISENFIPRSLTNQRPYLVASLQRFYVLPNRTTEENVAGTAKRILDLHWKKMGMVFPTNSELVLCHSLLNPIELGTVHAGVLFNAATTTHILRRAEVLDHSFDWISQRKAN